MRHRNMVQYAVLRKIIKDLHDMAGGKAFATLTLVAVFGGAFCASLTDSALAASQFSSLISISLIIFDPPFHISEGQISWALPTRCIFIHDHSFASHFRLSQRHIQYNTALSRFQLTVRHSARSMSF